MSKPEYWWCVKEGGKLLAYTVARMEQGALRRYNGLSLPKSASIVRIRVEEVKPKP